MASEIIAAELASIPAANLPTERIRFTMILLIETCIARRSDWIILSCMVDNLPGVTLAAEQI